MFKKFLKKKKSIYFLNYIRVKNFNLKEDGFLNLKELEK
jgi:hypothetical protein